MTGIGLAPALAVLCLLLLAIWGAGWILAAALLPSGREHRAERAGWGLACGFAVLAGGALVARLLAVRPGLGSALILLALLLPLAWRFRLAPAERPADDSPGSPVAIALAVLALLGIGAFFLRALTEPMWGNDYLAIWGLKGKSLFLSEKFPEHLWRDSRFAFSHPEYPIGLPLLLAGAAGLLGRWDDHALALLFPLFQIVTLLVLLGWLRRRGASRTLALAVTAAVSLFAPLYSAFMAGMAEIPAAFGFLLVGTALSDALDRTDAGALRRLAFASLVSSATKNEGLFFVALALVMSLVYVFLGRSAAKRAGAQGVRGTKVPRVDQPAPTLSGRPTAIGLRPDRWGVPLALLVPAAVSAALHRLALGSHPLRDLDFGYLFRPEFGSRLIEGLGFIARLHVLPSLGLLAALLALLLLGRRAPAGDRLLMLAAMLSLVYVILPTFCVYGPEWLVRWAIGRTFLPLFPIVLVAIAARLGRDAGPAAGEKIASPA